MSLIPFIVTKTERRQSMRKLSGGNTPSAVEHRLAFTASSADHPAACYLICDVREDGMAGFTSVPVFGDIHTGCTLMCKPHPTDATKMGAIVAVLPAGKL